MAIRRDDTGFGGLILLQDTDSFCYGIDAVLLADYCRAEPSDRVLELGSGNGAASLIVMGKYSPSYVLGIEVQPRMQQLACETAKLNGLEDRLQFVQGDVKDIREFIEAGTFDRVICNPPYAEAGRGPVSQTDEAYIARHETTATLQDFVSAAACALKPGGKFTIVHRPSRLPDLFEACRSAGLEPKQMRLVIPRPGASPNIVLLTAAKGGGKELQIDPALCVRSEDGSYSAELQRIYGRA